MTKYILIMKICSADCAANGTLMTANALSEMGPDLVNSNKIYVTFKCKSIMGA